MKNLSLYFWLVVGLALPILNGTSAAQNNGSVSIKTEAQGKVPSGAILVKGAWSSASDSSTPLPENGHIVNNVFRDDYFGLTYALPQDWTERYQGPPPSDGGRYVLAQLGPTDAYRGTIRGSILITAQDLFFASQPAANALELVSFSENHLQADYKLERPLQQTTIAGHSFAFFAYASPISELHWYVLSTEIRCHLVEFVLASRDTRLLQNLTQGMNQMKLPAEAGATAGTGGGDVPVCMKDYASDENMISRVEPVFTEHRFNPVPIRIIIDKQGKVRHIHFLSAFPDQAMAISDAMEKWRFKPYMRGREPVEVETGILFGSVRTPTRNRTRD
jgi:hypothetical protein